MMISESFIYLLLSINRVKYSSSKFFSTTKNILTALNSSSSTLSVFFKAAYHTNPGAERNLGRSS